MAMFNGHVSHYWSVWVGGHRICALPLSIAGLWPGGFFNGSIYTVVSWNKGTPKSSILVGFSSINHPAIGVPPPHFMLFRQFHAQAKVPRVDWPCKQMVEMPDGFTSNTDVRLRRRKCTLVDLWIPLSSRGSVATTSISFLYDNFI